MKINSYSNLRWNLIYICGIIFLSISIVQISRASEVMLPFGNGELQEFNMGLRAVQRDGQAGIRGIDGSVIKVSGASSILSNSEALAKRTHAVVKIKYELNGEPQFCTGIYLDKYSVLTAAHCACASPDSYEISPLPNFSITDKPQPHRGLVSLPEQMHPNNCAAGGAIAGYDLAILRPLRPAALQIKQDLLVRIPMVGMLPIYRDTETDFLFIMGYGLTENGDEPKDKQTGFVSIASHFCSNSPFGCAKFQEFVLANNLDSVGQNLTDTCGGDSGGPVFYSALVEKEEDTIVEELLLVGVASRAIDIPANRNGLRCGGGGIYTAIGRSDVLEWLDSLQIDYAFRILKPKSVQ